MTDRNPGLGKNRKTPPSTKKHRGGVLLATAQRLTSSYFKQHGENLPGSSMLGCLRWRAYSSDQGNVDIDVTDGDAEFVGMFKCGSNKCPRCSNSIVAKNRSWIRAELLPSLELHGLKCSMITLTLSHNVDDDWGDSVICLDEAYKRWDKRMNKIYKKLGYVGKLRSFEVTVGFNGIHPHFHILMPHRELSEDELSLLVNKMREAWAQAVAEVGRNVNSHGFDFSQNAAETYCAKMELAHEMASSSKSARRKGKTPQQLLLAASKGDAIAGMWWQKVTKAVDLVKRFTAGGMPKKLGIKTPSQWDDIPTNASVDFEEEDIDADMPDDDWMPDYVAPAEPAPVVVNIRYKHDDHMLATHPSLGRAGLAMILRAASRGGQASVDSMVGALVREYHAKVAKVPFWMTWDVGDRMLVELYPDILDIAGDRPLSLEEVRAYLATKRSMSGAA